MGQIGRRFLFFIGKDTEFVVSGTDSVAHQADPLEIRDDALEHAVPENRHHLVC